MVAVVTELMVGGERSTQNDSTKGSARTLVSKPCFRALLQAAGRKRLPLTEPSPLLTDTLTQTFFTRNFSLAVRRRTIHCGRVAGARIDFATFDLTKKRIEGSVVQRWRRPVGTLLVLTPHLGLLILALVGLWLGSMGMHIHWASD